MALLRAVHSTSRSLVRARRPEAATHFARSYASSSTLFTPAALVHIPSEADADGAELVSAADARLSITERAAEVCSSIMSSID